MNFLDKWNKAKFNVYESEEKTVLKIVKNISDFTGELSKGIDGKTDLTGNHQGSWQGLSKPTLSDEGMRATVEKLDIDFKDIATKVANKTVIFITDTVDEMQFKIDNDISGIVEFSSGNYFLTKSLFLKGNTNYNGNYSNIYCNDSSVELKENNENITINNFNFIGNLKFSYIRNISLDRYSATVENAVFKVGDVVGCSNFGVVDTGYLTIVRKVDNTYTFNRTINDDGRLLEDKYGMYLGTFKWSALLKGNHRNHGFRLNNCTFKLSNGYAFTVPNTKDIEISNCNIKENGLDCCLFSAEDGTTKHLLIDNVVFNQQMDMGKQGIVIMNKDGQVYEDITIKNCTFNGTTESGVSFGYANGLLNGVKIINNTFNNCNLFSIHIGGKNIYISGNRIVGSLSAVRYNDVSSVRYLPKTKDLMSNITITDNFMEDTINGITITTIKDNNEETLYPQNVIIANNNIHSKYLTCEVCGDNITINNNNLRSDTKQSAEGGDIANIYISGNKNSNVKIYNNNLSGYSYIRWGDIFNLLVENNVFNATPHAKGSWLIKSTNEPSKDRLIVISNNIFKDGSTSSMLTTNNGNGGEEFKGNVWVSASNENYKIPYMKGISARWQNTNIDSGINKSHWVNNANENWITTREDFLINDKYYAYITPNGEIKTSTSLTNLINV